MVGIAHAEIDFGLQVRLVLKSKQSRGTSGPLVSVVIPSYRSAETIGRTLQALSEQEGYSAVAAASCSEEDLDIDFEIIVVNSFPDETAEIVRTGFPHVKLIDLDQQTPAGKARNIGADQATGTYMGFVDSDCVVVPRWLRSCVENFSDDYCAIGGPIENSNPESVVSCAGHILEFSEFYAKQGQRSVDHLPSGNVFFLRETFLRMGGYPTEFFPQEDRYFSWMLRRDLGKELIFHEDILVTHHHRTSLRSFLAHQSLIGKAGAEILQNTDLPGSNVIKGRWALNLLMPAFPLVKLFRSIGRTLRFKPREILLQPHVLPLLAMGMWFWMLGFARQANRRKERSGELDG